jgi:hypothetical protein
MGEETEEGSKPSFQENGGGLKVSYGTAKRTNSPLYKTKQIGGEVTPHRDKPPRDVFSSPDRIKMIDQIVYSVVEDKSKNFNLNLGTTVRYSPSATFLDTHLDFSPSRKPTPV